MSENSVAVSVVRKPVTPKNLSVGVIAVIIIAMCFTLIAVGVGALVYYGAKNHPHHTLYASYAASVSATLSVDPQMPYADQIAAGNYTETDSEVLDHNFVSRSYQHEVKAKMLQASCRVTTEDALTQMNKEHSRPADVFDLLAFGAKQVDIDADYGIVELGSSYHSTDGNQHYIVIDVNKGKRRLVGRETWSDKTWPAGTYFLVVQEPDNTGFKM